MNEDTSKKINFNKTSLLGLKAELLKKKEEVKEKKHLPQHKVQNFKPVKKSSKNLTETDKVTLKDKLKEVDSEEFQAHRKSKSALEKKTELYEHLADGAGTSEFASRFLVDFSTKKNQEPTIKDPVAVPVFVPETELEINENDWVEFTDCLGRTRRCLKTDYEIFKKQDEKLAGIVSNENEAKEELKETKEKPLLVQKTNDYLLTLREKWEKKEQELLAKDKDIHYQDVLFDEARMHGVGYFAFSTEETERRKQMEELMKTREETLKAQQEALAKRQKREELMAARLKAVKERRRLKQGLPPEDPEENKEKYMKCLLDFLNKQKKEADEKAEEEQRKEKEEIEQERQKLREAYVREWDIGKDGVEDKKFREMTQEEYVEQQRGKRIDEFAPPKESTRKKESTFDDNGRFSSAGRASKTWAEVRQHEDVPPPPIIGDLTEIKGLYFSSHPKETNKSNKAKKTVKYKNFVHTQEPVLIENELSDNDDNENQSKKPEKRKPSAHTEVAPPPTYEYYGPVPKHSKSTKPFSSNATEAFEQGTKSLEAKGHFAQLSKNYDFSLE